MTIIFVFRFLLSCLVFSAVAGRGDLPCAAQENKSISELRNQAIRKAIQRVEKYVIRLDLFPVGEGQPKVGTALVTSSDGLIITSSFLVPSNETRVVANIGTRKLAAKLIGKDDSRKLTLLKVQEVKDLPFAKLSNTACRVGESVIALGRTLSPQSPNVSTGIISAKNRIWGMALQTDAKISPTNYGGPLVNLKGQILGLLTQISPDENDMSVSEEWYDSGIGFAIPANDVANSIDRIEKAGSVERGRIGIQFQQGNQLRGKLIVTNCFPRSPASMAGIKPDDLVTRVNDQAVTSLNQFKNATFRFYANDTIRIEVKRDNKALVFPLTLSGPLSLYRFPYLGFIPDLSLNASGVTISQVDRLGPLHDKVFKGDQIVEVNDKKINNQDELKQAMGRLESGQPIRLKIIRNQDFKTITTTLAELKTDLESDSYTYRKSEKSDFVETEFKVSGYSNSCRLLLPRNPLPENAQLIVFLADTKVIDQPGLENLDELAATGRYGLLIAYPDSVDGWQNQETEFLLLAIQKAIRADPRLSQVVILTVGKTGALACRVAIQNRMLVRGLIFVDPREYNGWTLPLSMPGQALHSLILSSGSNRDSLRSANLAIKLKASGLPTRMQLVKNVGLTPKALSTITEWIWLSNRL